MKRTKLLLATSVLTAVGGISFAASHSEMEACEDCANDMTLVSWGGAYQASQTKAYAEPYMEMFPEVSVAWDESSAEAVAKLRAMNEAGNVTWDLVDVVASDAIRLCDEGLAMEIDPDEDLAAAPDGTSAEDDFGDLLVSDCFIPQIVYSTTFGYRTDLVPDGVEPPSDICSVFDLETYPGKRALEKRPVSAEAIEVSVERIRQTLRARGDREVNAREIGEAVMKALRSLDQVAYIRFASVYRKFQDLDEFRAEIDRLSQEPTDEPEGSGTQHGAS